MEPENGASKLSRVNLGAPRHQGRCDGPIHARRRAMIMVAAVLLLAIPAATTSKAAPALVIDAGSGAVLYEQQATLPWYPASLTKLMTAYVALKALREHRISLDTPLAVSTRAVMAPPSKMGFRPGTLVTLDNALKMLMVKSANDIAVTIAEGVSGSVEAFAEDMNEAAVSLGLGQSHFVNPNGLPDPRHVSSARDLAILAQALIRYFPDHAELFSIGALRLGDDIIKNHNNMLGRYPGADGMKTGFTCAAGFNLVASATRDGRKIIAVVLGAPNVEQRTLKTAILFDRAFAGIDRPSGDVAALSARAVALPPDMRGAICRKPAATIAEFGAEIDRLSGPFFSAGHEAGTTSEGFSPYSSGMLAAGAPMAPRITMVPQLAFDPVPVSIGAADGYAGSVARARPSHTPIGTEGPPAVAQAYAATRRSPLEERSSPVAPDVATLPMKGQKQPAQPAAVRKAAVQAAGSARIRQAPRQGKTAAASTKPTEAKWQAEAAPKPPVKPAAKH